MTGILILLTVLSAFGDPTVGTPTVSPKATKGSHKITWTVQGAVKQVIARSHNGGVFQEVHTDFSGKLSSLPMPRWARVTRRRSLPRDRRDGPFRPGLFLPVWSSFR
jgi:hypothetical protein